MKLKTKILQIESGGFPVVVLNIDDAEDLGIKTTSRIKLKHKRKESVCIVNIAKKMVERGYIGIYKEVKDIFKLKDGEEVEVTVAPFPSSLQYIRERLKGRRLTKNKIYEIIKDVVNGNLSEVEITAFVVSLHYFGLSLEEATNLTMAMVETGKKLNIKKRPVLDKHSIGGAAGDKTSMILVPIIASLGYTIPKTSSRAVTSAAGTADKAECLMPVSLEIDEMKRVVKKTNGCLVWGGRLGLAPADERFVNIEYPLHIDPLLFPSIMSKKKAVGATHLIIDIPTGRGMKVKTIGDANFLAKDFIELGKRLGIKINVTITNGEQPIGYAIGPSLEAREALEIIMRKKTIGDQEDKVFDIAEALLKLVGDRKGRAKAMYALKSGKAEKKLREIIKEQGGNPRIKPEDIPIGEYTLDVNSPVNGVVFWIDTRLLVDLAKLAGAPKYRGAGIVINKKIGDKVRKGEKLFTVFAERERKLDLVEKVLLEKKPYGVGKKSEMLIQIVKEKIKHRKTFVLER